METGSPRGSSAVELRTPNEHLPRSNLEPCSFLLRAAQQHQPEEPCISAPRTLEEGLYDSGAPYPPRRRRGDHWNGLGSLGVAGQSPKAFPTPSSSSAGGAKLGGPKERQLFGTRLGRLRLSRQSSKRAELRRDRGVSSRRSRSLRREEGIGGAAWIRGAALTRSEGPSPSFQRRPRRGPQGCSARSGSAPTLLP